MKNLITKKAAYFIVFLIMFIALMIYTYLNHNYRLSEVFEKTPHLIGSLGAITIFCLKRKFDMEQSNDGDRIDR